MTHHKPNLPDEGLSGLPATLRLAEEMAARLGKVRFYSDRSLRRGAMDRRIDNIEHQKVE